MSEHAPENNPYAAPTAVLDDRGPGGDAAGPKLASRWSRLLATVIDHLLVAGPPVLAYMYGPNRPRAPLEFNDPSSVGLGFFLASAFSLAILVCNIFLLRFNGQTVGKQIMRIKLVRSDGYSYVSVWRIIGLRFLPVYLASRWIPVVGPAVWGVEALSIFGGQRKCLHDYLADTIVITEGGAARHHREPPAASEAPKSAPQPEEFDPARLVVVAEVDGPVEAAFARGVLEEQEIPCRLDFEPVRGHDPVLGSSSGGARLLVDVDDVDAAVELLSDAADELDGDDELALEFDWDDQGVEEE